MSTRSSITLGDQDIDTNNVERLYKYNPTKFVPRLYSFKVPKNTYINETALANSPPFWVLVDHLIAVVWKLYSRERDGRKLGITQLQWALEFIKMIKDNNGNLTKTLEKVKNTIEDAIILKYTNLPSDDKKGNDETVSGEGKQISGGKSSNFEGVPQTSQTASFTLRDLMARSPKNLEKPAAIPTTELPLDGTRGFANVCTENSPPAKAAPQPPDVIMKKEDILKYLSFMKNEQLQRIEKEKNELERIQTLI